MSDLLLRFNAQAGRVDVLERTVKPDGRPELHMLCELTREETNRVYQWLGEVLFRHGGGYKIAQDAAPVAAPE